MILDSIRCIKNHIIFIVFFIILIVLIYYDWQINITDAKGLDELILKFFSLENSYLENKSFQNVVSIIREITSFRIYALASCSMVSTIVTIIFKRVSNNQSIKIYGISPKCYASFYSKYRKIIFIIFSICFATLLKLHITLLYICVSLGLYSLQILLFTDYTLEIKEGIKKGYIKYIKNHKKYEEYLYKVRNSNYQTMMKDRTILFYQNSECLLENFIVHSLDTFNQKKYMENYEVLRFSVELLEEFYKRLNDENIKLFIKQLQKCINAFFVSNIDADKNFEYFVNAFIKVLTRNNEKIYNDIILLCLYIMIFKIPSVDNTKKESYVKIIKNGFSMFNYENSNIIANSIYTVLFYSCIYEKRVPAENILFKNAFGQSMITNKLDNTYLLQIYKLSKKTIDYFDFDYQYSNFDRQFLFIAHYFRKDLLEGYIEYLKEVK